MGYDLLVWAHMGLTEGEEGLVPFPSQPPAMAAAGALWHRTAHPKDYHSVYFQKLSCNVTLFLLLHVSALNNNIIKVDEILPLLLAALWICML